MALADALQRFESVIGAAWPEQFGTLQAGVEDAQLQALRDAVAPYLLPAQVEELYRWRGGGWTSIFGGWNLQPIDRLIETYRLNTSEFDYPRVWLPVFGGEKLVNIVTLDLPGAEPSDQAVWAGDTHDVWIWRLFESIEALVDVVCDAAEAGALVEQWYGLVTREGDSLAGHTWTEFRLRRGPDTFRWPDPPPGSNIYFFPDPSWPRTWLLASGSTENG